MWESRAADDSIFFPLLDSLRTFPTSQTFIFSLACLSCTLFYFVELNSIFLSSFIIRSFCSWQWGFSLAVGLVFENRWHSYTSPLLVLRYESAQAVGGNCPARVQIFDWVVPRQVLLNISLGFRHE